MRLSLVRWQSIHHDHLLTASLRCVICNARCDKGSLRNTGVVSRWITRSHGSTGSTLAWRTSATVAAHRSVATTTTAVTEQTATAQGTDHQQASTNACETRHQRASGVLLRIQQQGGMVNGRDPKRTNLRHRNAEFLVQPQIKEKKSANIREERTRGDLNCRNHSSSGWEVRRNRQNRSIAFFAGRNSLSRSFNRIPLKPFSDFDSSFK